MDVSVTHSLFASNGVMPAYSIMTYDEFGTPTKKIILVTLTRQEDSMGDEEKEEEEIELVVSLTEILENFADSSR